MKATAIQLKKSYEVSLGRGTTIVKVIDINPKTGAWICETQGGKSMTIGDATRFIKAVNDRKGAKQTQKDNKPALQTSSAPKKSRDKGDDGTLVQKPEPNPQAAPSPAEKPTNGNDAQAATEKPETKPVADTETLEQLRKAVKEANKKLRTAKNALQFGFIDRSTLDEATVEYNEVCEALKAAGGQLGTGGRCLGQMSSRDAAFKVLCETGESMNGRQICEMALDKGYWEPQGETPEATMVSSILTEMKRKGDAARFIRTGRGLFAAKQ